MYNYDFSGGVLMRIGEKERICDTECIGEKERICDTGDIMPVPLSGTGVLQMDLNTVSLFFPCNDTLCDDTLCAVCMKLHLLP